MKNPKTSLRRMKEIKKEDYTKEKFKQEAEQVLVKIKNEEIKMQQVREKNRQLEINRDILLNILKIKIDLIST